jgi:cysteine desulfurase
MTKQIYLDNAATTAMDKKVFLKMKPYFEYSYGNPSSFHSFGKQAKDVIGEAREKVARVLNCKTSEIIFTAGGTESDNLAILGAAKARGKAAPATQAKQACLAGVAGRGHIITSKLEHHAVLYPCEYLEKNGFSVSYIKPGKDGIVAAEDVASAVKPDTFLVSIMYANNEIGTIEPIKEIVRAVKKKNKNILVHTDACQAGGVLNIDVDDLGVDLMTLNGSKLYGPKGVGVLYKRTGVKIEPITYGGGQESGMRPGTENVAGIVGFAEGLELAQKSKDKENKRLTILREKLINGIIKNISGTELNGGREHRLPNNVNISFAKVEGEAVVLYLDSFGVYAATGSACTSRSLEPSHVIKALGKPDEVAHSSIRFTLGKDTKEVDINFVIKILPKIIEDLRKISVLR